LEGSGLSVDSGYEPLDPFSVDRPLLDAFDTVSANVPVRHKEIQSGRQSLSAIGRRETIIQLKKAGTRSQDAVNRSQDTVTRSRYQVSRHK